MKPLSLSVVLDMVVGDKGDCTRSSVTLRLLGSSFSRLCNFRVVALLIVSFLDSRKNCIPEYARSGKADDQVVVRTNRNERYPRSTYVWKS